MKLIYKITKNIQILYNKIIWNICKILKSQKPNKVQLKIYNNNAIIKITTVLNAINNLYNVLFAKKVIKIRMMDNVSK